MKRMRDDVGFGSSQFKRPVASSRGESYGQSQVPGGGGGGGNVLGTSGAVTGASQKLTTNDALSYLKEVKDMFQDQREKYDTFLEVMKDFKAQRTDTAGVIARVKELFKGHNNLIYGFNTFLPKGYEITLDEVETPPKKTVEFEEAISFVNKIKKRFQNDEHVYKSFLDILNMYRKEHKDITEVYSEVASLFEDHPDLLDEFTRFLPDNSVTSATHQVPYGRNANQRYNERNPAAPSLRQMHMEKQRRRERMLTSHGERDLSVDRPEMDDDKLMTKVKDQRKRSEKDVRDRRNRDLDDREPEQDSTRDIGMQRYNDKKPVRKVEGFGMNSNFASFDDRGMYNQALVFCDKVKEKLGSSDDYQAFLKCLNIFNSGIIKRNELQNLVADLIGKFPDLMEEFNDFLERCENIDGFLTGVMSKRTMATDGHVAKPLKIEDKDREPKRELDVPKEKDRYKEKYMKCVNDLDLSNCQRCTPSYRLLPDDYPIPTASQKSELGAQVLNDYWVSVTSGSEDYSFKHMRKNQYEESLFRCEDDRFELDLLLESVSSTAKRAEELLNIINENKVGTVFRIEDHFTALNLRCIERLYGDHGLDVMDILRRNPPVALPVVLTRLKQKQDEWTTCRSDFNKVWAEIYAKNHYKSLDHRSFYFKQQDSKNLSTKSLVAEIKELKEKQQKEDDVLLAFAAGNRQTVVPHLQFEYSDVSIHKDLSKLVQYSCEEVCSTKEQLSKVMRLWTMFMEPILGASRLNGTEKSHNNGKGGQPTDCTTSTAAENGAISHIDPTPSRSKLPKLATNCDETASPDPQNLFRTRSVNGSVTAKEDGQLLLALTSKEDANSSTPPLEKQQNGLDMTDRVSGLISMQAASDLNSNVSAMVGGENNHGRSDIALAGSDSTLSTPAVASCEDHKVKAGNDVAGPSSMNGIVAKSVLSASGMLMDGSKVGRYAAEPNVPSKIEKEEGELSPNGEFEDFGISPEGKYNVERQHHELGNGEELRSHDADADDEDSDNASEAGDDASGSESAGDECSREEDEDAEHDEVDGKAESEGEADGTADAQFSGGDAHVPERFFSSVRPLVKHFPPSVLNEERKRDTHIFYGNDDFYVLFRLHQILYERILSAKINSTAGEMKWRTSKDSDSDPYGRFMSALYNLLDGSFDNAKFEDECRAILGNQSYVLFTLDKLLYKLIKQLQTVAGDEMDNKLLQLYEYEKSRKAGKFVDTVYYDNARYLLYEENIYRLEFSSVPCRTSIQLMDNINEKPEVLAVSMDPDFAAYLHNDFLSLIPGKKEVQGITLQRNKRKYASTDELSALTRAMEGVKMHNGLECKISCNSCKISYVLDTEDFFFRVRRRKSSQGHDQLQKRVQRFRKFLSAS